MNRLSLEEININPERMALLFLGHGNPMYAIQKNIFTEAFQWLGDNLIPPKAILCISAHWYIRGTKVTAMDFPKTIHDFGGFPEALFQVQYPAPGSPALAKEVVELLNPVNVALDYDWGLDHGTWSVIKHLYPEADIPVVQLSIDYSQPALFHFELANKLRSLREKGVLIVGSGNIIHNLRAVDYQNMDQVDYGYAWAQKAHEEINELLVTRQFEKLVDYQNLSESVQKAIPTPDHYLPLLYVLGIVKDNDTMTLFNDRLVGGSLSMTSILIH